MYNNKQEDKTHQKWELKKQKTLQKKTRSQKKRGEKRFSGILVMQISLAAKNTFIFSTVIIT